MKMFYDFGMPVSPEVLMALKREIMESLHVALPGIVERFDPDAGTADVRPALRRLVGADGEAVTVPILREVPVFLPGFSDPDLKLAVKPGDMCLLIFADVNIDGWYETGSATLPASGRTHDWSDAFAFVGFRCKRSD